MSTSIESEQQFNSETQNGFVLVMFYVNGCGACRLIRPIYEKLVPKYPSLRFFKVDLDGPLNYLRKTQSISTLPTFHLFKNGKVVGVETGADEVGQALEEFIQEFVQPTNQHNQLIQPTKLPNKQFVASEVPRYQDQLVTYL